MRPSSSETAELVRVSLRAARRNPRLWYLGAALTAVRWIEPWLTGTHHPERETVLQNPLGPWPTPTQYAASLVTGVLSAWLLVALTLAALSILRGNPLPLKATIDLTWKKLQSIVVFGTLFWAGNELLSAIGRLQPPGLSWAMVIAGWAWCFSLYLAYPVLAREEGNGLQSFTRAWSLIRVGWASRLLGGLSLTLRFLLCAIPLAILGATVGAIVEDILHVGSAKAFAPWALIPLGVFFLVADQLFDSGLYMSLADQPSSREPHELLRNAESVSD